MYDFTQIKNNILYLYCQITETEEVKAVPLQPPIQTSDKSSDKLRMKHWGRSFFWTSELIVDRYELFESLNNDLYKVYDKYIYPSLITLCIKTCRVYNIINDYHIHLYNTNENVKTIVDKIQYNITSFYSFLINRKSEPEDPVWCCVAWTTTNYRSLTKYYNYNEEYLNFFTKYFCNDLFKFDLDPDCNSGYALNYIKSLNSYIQQKPNALFPLIIIKTITPENKSIVSVRRSNTSLQPFVYSKSKVKFICLEYVHTEMTKTIEIKLEDGFYISGNELFTPTFVLRILEYQSNGYFFDENYKIRIMDSECKIIEFGIESYLLLTENGYEIISDNTITSVLNKEEQISRLSHQEINPFISTWLTENSTSKSDKIVSQDYLCQDDSDSDSDFDCQEDSDIKSFILNYSNDSNNIASLYTSFEFGSMSFVPQK